MCVPFVRDFMKLFIGNISYNTSEAGLRSFFEEFGPLLSVKIATDRDTGRSRGFGFIEFEDREKAEQAINARNNADLDGKNLVVNEARPKEAGSGPRGGGNRSGGGNRFGGNSGGRSSSSRGGYSGGRW
jgi:cold-inducible RNA-binding protein